MVKPNEREKKEVAKIPALSRREISDLKNILLALGFDNETIALLWNKTAAEVEHAFSVGGLSGEDLLLFCEYIQLRPGVVQRKLNFDRRESRLKTLKVGFKSTPAPARWIGPPELCVVGNASDGKAFREVYQTPGVSVRASLDPKVLQQIANGNWPVRLPLLHDVVASALAAQVTHRKLAKLVTIRNSFPETIQSVEDVFAPAKTRTIRPEEGQIMNKHDMGFANSFAAAGLSSKLSALIDRKGLSGWVHDELDWDDDTINTFADGETGPLPDQLKQFLTYCQTAGITGDDLESIQNFFDENSQEVSGAVEPTVQTGPETGHYGELWYDDRVEMGGVIIPRIGSNESLSTRVYATLLAIRNAFELQWSEIETKLGMTHQNVLSMQSGKQAFTSKFIEVLPKALKKHFGPDLTIQEILGIDELPELVSAVAEAEAPEAPKAEGQEEGSDVVQAAQEVVEVPSNGWPQVAIAEFIKTAVAQDPELQLEQIMRAAGLNMQSNSRVMRGLLFYSRQHLESIAQSLDVSFKDLSSANLAVLQKNGPVADGDMAAVAENIARLIAAKGLRTFDVLSAAGIRYRPHNAMVVKGQSGYSYTETQLSDIAAAIGVSVEELYGKAAPTTVESVPAPVESTEEITSAPEPTAVDSAPQEAVALSYDSGDKELRKVVGRQLKRLKEALGVPATVFLQDLRVNSPSVFYGTVTVYKYMLEDVVSKYKKEASWLTVEWFLTDAAVVEELVLVDTAEPAAQREETTSAAPVEEVVPVITSEPEAKAASPEPVGDDASDEVVTEPEVEPQIVVAEPPAAQEAVVSDEADSAAQTSAPFMVQFAKTYGVEGKSHPLEWRKLFFVFARAGFVDGKVLANLLEPFTVQQNIEVDWRAQVLAVAGPVLQSVYKAPELESIAQDASLMKVLSELSALDVLLLGRELDQNSSQTRVTHQVA